MLRERAIVLVVFVAIVFSSLAGAVVPAETLIGGDTAAMRICKGDIDLDGYVNALDVDPFVALFSANLTNVTEGEGGLLIWLGDFNNDSAVTFDDINPFKDTIAGKIKLVCIPDPRFKLYDFVREIDIRAYQCRLGPHPTDFPAYFNVSICNRQFIEVTHDNKLDRPDKQIVGGDSWMNYATHHFFVLRNVDRSKLRRFSVGYVTYNKFYRGEEHHYIYVKNFNTNEWELLDEAYAPRYRQGFMGYVSNFGNKTSYVNEGGEMWFMGTEGPHSGRTIGTDTFAAVLRFSAFGVESLDEIIAPAWMKFVYK